MENCDVVPEVLRRGRNRGSHVSLISPVGLVTIGQRLVSGDRRREGPAPLLQVPWSLPLWNRPCTNFLCFWGIMQTTVTISTWQIQGRTWREHEV